MASGRTAPARLTLWPTATHCAGRQATPSNPPDGPLVERAAHRPPAQASTNGRMRPLSVSAPTATHLPTVPQATRTSAPFDAPAVTGGVATVHAAPWPRSTSGSVGASAVVPSAPTATHPPAEGQATEYSTDRGSGVAGVATISQRPAARSSTSAASGPSAPNEAPTNTHSLADGHATP